MVIGATCFSWSDADAVVCVKTNKKGVVTKVTIRGDACKRKESVGDATALLGLPPTTSSTTTTTLPPLGRAPQIVDSAGNNVGWLTSMPGLGVVALRTIDDQAVALPMSSFGPALNFGGVFTIDDFQYGFVRQGTQCVGERFSTAPSTGDLLSIVFPSADGTSGYLFTSEKVTEVGNGSYATDSFKYECALLTPPTVTCDDVPDAVVTPVGQAFECSPNSVVQSDPASRCTCIRCCATVSVQPPDPPVSLYRVKTVDLGLGNVTPPFKIQP